MVSDELSGLRFDIYERVHLPDDVTGINELNELELTPHIQVHNHGEHAVLKGNLLLLGSYVGDGAEQQVQKLQHSIPVEITLPMNRIQKLEDIGVEIENFDVDLLSSRSLNVTGILSLRGIEVASSAREDWREDEELVFVHQADIQPDAAASTGETQQEAQEDGESAVEERSEIEQAPPDEVIVEAEVTEVTEEDEVGEQETELAGDITPFVSKTEEEADEKIDLKIAFGSKKAAEHEDAKGIDLKSLLHKSSSGTSKEYQDADAERQGIQSSEEPNGSEEASSSGDSLEWKKLFLTPDHEAHQFRKVRMCIVQREETIELIADRYSLNPREIILYNRLGEQSISEGQVIYIPIS